MFMNESVDYDSDKIKKMVFAALFAALIAVGAYIRIMFGPIPFTLQTFFVLLAAVTLGRNWGTISVIVYLIVGCVGFPVFAGGSSGIGIFFGPTGGYLYSFIPVSILVGGLSDILRSKTSISLFKNSLFLFFIAALGSLLILFIGTIHLSFSSRLPLPIAFTTGFLPFLFSDFLKSLFVGLVAPRLIQKVNFGSAKNQTPFQKTETEDNI